MKVLITGNCGFIGSHVSNACLEKGWNVVGVDDLSAGNNKPIVHEQLLCDFTDDNVLSRIQNKEFDFIFHLAAKPSVPYSIKFPSLTYKENVLKSMSLIDASVYNVKKFIFSSSSSIYGDSINLPTKEESLILPKSPYAMHKSIIESYLSVQNALYDLNYSALRYFNVFGPNGNGSGAYATCINSWIYCIKNKLPLRFDGDGEQSRDMCYVKDVAIANVMAAISDTKEKVFNVGTGIKTSNLEILNEFKKYFEFQVDYAPARLGDVKITLADISKLKKELNFITNNTFKHNLYSTFFEEKLIGI